MDPADAPLTAWLCAHLPQLTTAATRDRWTHKLDAALAAIRAGAPVAEALTTHQLPVDLDEARAERIGITRGPPGTLNALGIDPVDVTGAYHCPAAAPCPRRAQPGPDGHEPRCGVHGTTMLLRRQ